MKAHVLQHVPFEDIGNIASCLEVHEATVGYTRFFESCALPTVDQLDLVIAMGGPMSVNDEASLPWLKAEKRFIRDAIGRGVPLIGICLGAQLIASALGSRVYRNHQKEIGWFNIEATPAAVSAFRFPEQCTVFHWHSDTFDLPHGAIQLAKNTACENQAFQIGRNVIGLQFHLETTPLSADSIITHSAHQLVEETYVQSETAMRAVSECVYEDNRRLMSDVLSYVIR